MKREELLNDLYEWLDGECIPATMTADLSHDFADILRSKLDAIKSCPALPPAEGAEEIIRKNCHTCFSRSTGQEEVWTSLESVIIAMTEFATLHAQRIAEKMVEDMRQKLFSMRSSKEPMYRLSEADRLMMYGYHDCINEMLMWTKPLSHD